MNGESAHLGLLLYEFMCYKQSKIHPCITDNFVLLTSSGLDGDYVPIPTWNIIAGNYILADMRAYLNKRHRQQNKEILIKHSPWMGECFWFSGIQITEKNFHQERSVIGGRRNKFLRENQVLQIRLLTSVKKTET